MAPVHQMPKNQIVAVITGKKRFWKDKAKDTESAHSVWTLRTMKFSKGFDKTKSSYKMIWRKITWNPSRKLYLWNISILLGIWNIMLNYELRQIHLFYRYANSEPL